MVSQPIEDDVIRVLSAKLERRVEPEVALDQIAQRLQGIGLTVRRRATIEPGLVFDIIGEEEGNVVVCVSLRHAAYQVTQFDQVQLFVEQLREVCHSPDAFGCFVTEGSLDKHLSELTNTSDVPLHLFDLTQNDFASQLSDVVRAQRRREGQSESDPAFPSGRRAAREATAIAELQQELESVKKAQSSFLDDLEQRRAVGEPKTVVNVAGLGDYRSDRREAYEDATKRVSFGQTLTTAVSYAGHRGSRSHRPGRHVPAVGYDASRPLVLLRRPGLRVSGCDFPRAACSSAYLSASCYSSVS